MMSVVGRHDGILQTLGSLNGFVSLQGIACKHAAERRGFEMGKRGVDL